MNNLTAQVSLDWTVGHSDTETVSPTEFVHATVPGAVQLDFAKAKNTAYSYWSPLRRSKKPERTT